MLDTHTYVCITRNNNNKKRQRFTDNERNINIGENINDHDYLI